MTVRKFPGGVAGPRKYDLITAIAVAGLRGDGLSGALALRLIAFITARYNWSEDCATVGQEDLATLWGVSRRTVIRDLERLRALGVLILLRQGCKGRVASYRLGHHALDTLTGQGWAQVGTRFEERMAAEVSSPPIREPSGGTGCPWSPVHSVLSRVVSPAVMAGWIDPLRPVSLADGILTVEAPTGFHADFVRRDFGSRIEDAARSIHAGLNRVEFISAVAQRARA